MSAVTGLIVAYNAENTIERALHSALKQVPQVIVVNDGSTDQTAARAQSFCADRVSVITHPKNRGIGQARRTALAHCETPYLCWLDADDEWLPGRIERLQAELDSGADYVFDEAELIDGHSLEHKSLLEIPDILFKTDGVLFQYGRNYLPSLGWFMARTEVVRRHSYQSVYSQAEDYSHFLMAMMGGARMAFIKHVGYRQYAYPTSASRQLDRQNRLVRKACLQIDSAAMMLRLSASALSAEDQFYIATLHFLRRADWQALLSHLNAWQGVADKLAWLRSFAYGVAYSQLRELAEAKNSFETSLSHATRAETLNNLGVVLSMMGEDGSQHFSRSLAIKHNYLDACRNCAEESQHMTLVPLREHRSRDDY